VDPVDWREHYRHGVSCSCQWLRVVGRWFSVAAAFLSRSWAMGWYARWYVSQFGLVERSRFAALNAYCVRGTGFLCTEYACVGLKISPGSSAPALRVGGVWTVKANNSSPERAVKPHRVIGLAGYPLVEQGAAVACH